MDKKVKTDELYESIPEILKDLFKYEYPWEILPHIKAYAAEIIKNHPKGYKLLKQDVLIGENVIISPTATIEGPTVIASGTEIRPGAYIRGSVIISENCVVGNSTELKNCVLLEKVQVPHYNYVGDSILGTKAHMGAGSICSNFKADGKNIVVRGQTNYETGLRKMGAMLGDGADIGCGCVLNPGTVIGKRTSVYPLTSLRGVFPADCIIKSADNIVKRI